MNGDFSNNTRKRIKTMKRMITDERGEKLIKVTEMKSEKQGKRIRIKIEMPLELYDKVKRASEEAGLSMSAWLSDASIKYARRLRARLNRG